MSDVTDILDDLQWRNLVASSTDLEHLRTAMQEGPITLYCGFDPTAPSLHLGNLSQILTVRRFQLAGHRPLALVGGATGLIGDPKMTGERILNEASTVDEWVARIRGQLERFYSFEGDNAAIVVNNYDWISKLSAIEFLRDVGKHFSVNRMLDREAVAARLAGPGISYTEFSYALLQGYDFLELSRRYDCTLQTGGSDQWGNITAGIDLIRRVESRSVHGLTTPLITKADGTKFGKTESGTVWLDPNLTSPYAFYQFWINADDRDVPTLLRTFSFKSHEEIEELEQATATRPQAREAQRALAEELTTLVHGSSATESVIAASRAIFGQGDLATLDAETLGAALSETPVVELPETVVAQGIPAFADLLAQSGLVASKGAARRTIAEGGAYLNNVRVTDEALIPTSADLIHGQWLVLRRGKKSLAAVRLSVSGR